MPKRDIEGFLWNRDERRTTRKATLSLRSAARRSARSPGRATKAAREEHRPRAGIAPNFLGTLNLFKKRLPDAPSNYCVPAWALADESASAAPWSFEVYKGAEKISTIDLSRQARFVCGRSGSEVRGADLDCGSHSSISRNHAVVQHGLDGTLWLYDYNSLRGTKVNSQPVQTETFQRLVVGDEIQFGKSNRIYKVQFGAASFASGESTFETLAVSAAKKKGRATKAKGSLSTLTTTLRSAANTIADRL
eukprot:CAMPEP_0205946370 /NCGR_PEP_ID=MMETSP1325-20131115/69007_1 /ASSEMBLY_ACC=CAM_ASM_000708 /TAXON_ID=236786 /ORGANISM="Florenciella sp., Strain RCC1007" /LENGTH=248 /DNA_ID=CAMNT_0053317433 /DNA_START=807 /DNA_END=1553 /DNA_ORIENTATION=+